MIVTVVLLSGCIHNNIPYPRIQPNFESMEARWQDAAAQIDSATRTVTLTFPETADLYDTHINSYTLSPGATMVDDDLRAPIDLSSPYYVTLHLYQDWLWKIVGKQEIERYFQVEDQMGETLIDIPAHRVFVYVGKNTDLSAIKIVKAKLGAEGSIMTPALSAGSTFDGHNPLSIEISRYGHTENWTVYVDVVTSVVTTNSVDTWTQVAWVYATAAADGENGVEYRLAGTEEWTRVPDSNVTDNNGSIKACIMHLSPQTAYETRAFSGENYGEILKFTTGAVVQMPNSDFEEWWQDGRVWCPWLEGSTPYWGTGNKGAATVGQSNSVPTTDTPSGTGYAAMLETKWLFVKLAAGNIFTGTYLRTDGTNGVLAFGREFTEHPVKLRGKFKYTCKNIDRCGDAEYNYLIGQPDTAIVYCALIDTPEPYEIRTSPKDRQLFDPNGDYVVGYGQMQCGETVASYVPFEFEIKYKSTSRKPKYIIVTASASKYGDFFAGGAGSVMYIDDFELVYDY